MKQLFDYIEVFYNQRAAAADRRQVAIPTGRRTMRFHIREARETDTPALARLHVQTFNETHRAGRLGMLVTITQRLDG